MIKPTMLVVGTFLALLLGTGCGYDNYYTILEEMDEVQKIELCPDIPATHPEYLLRIDGELFGVYFGGGKTFLALLLPGDYVTTDGRDCRFKVDGDLNVEVL